MTHEKSPMRAAAGKLTSAIQKEWNAQAGEDDAEESENVMYASQEFLHVSTSEELRRLLNGKSIPEYLGAEWVAAHPGVLPFIKKLEATL